MVSPAVVGFGLGRFHRSILQITLEDRKKGQHGEAADQVPEGAAAETDVTLLCTLPETEPEDNAADEVGIEVSIHGK